MGKRVLITYATKYGATAEIADIMGQEIEKADLSVEVLPVDRVRDLVSYDAVVLGSSVYIGRWRKEAAKFLKTNENILAEKPVWLFSSGPTGEGDPAELLKGWRLPKSLRPIADRINPKDIAVFHGAVNREKLGLISRWMIKKVEAPVGDFRDWDAIASWARTIADGMID